MKTHDGDMEACVWRTPYTSSPWRAVWTAYGTTSPRWRIEGNYSDLTGGWLVLATVHDPDGKANSNAQTMAAAPELLEASRWMLALIDGGEAMPKPGDEVAEALRAAIYKATGAQ